MVSLVTGTLVAAVLLPILMSIGLARYQAEQHFNEELFSYSKRINQLANLVISEAKTALNDINRNNSQTCDRAHLQAMRRVAFTHRFVQEVIFLKGPQALCSSLEQESHISPFPEPERVNKEGYSFWFTHSNDLGIRHYMLAVSREDHMVVLDPRSFIDVLPLTSWPINTAVIGLTRNRVLVSNAPFSQAAWQNIQDNQLTRFKDSGKIYSVYRNRQAGFAVMAWASHSPMQATTHRQLMLWLPVGIIISLLATALVLRLLKHLQSPRSRLFNAIHSKELTVCYQPIMRLNDKTFIGAEALVRWPQADGSELTPNVFIPLAEQTGLISSITRLVIETVFQELGEWLHQHPRYYVSINLAADDLKNNALLGILVDCCQRYRVSPQQIALEITERGFADPQHSAPVIKQYRLAGHRIYIDDFGTGYSSLSYLQNLDVDVLKIDKSFVDALEYDAVTPHIIDMAKHLHLEIVAEGIETECQAEWLQNHGVQYGQGWLYSKALRENELKAWCLNHHGSTVARAAR